MEEPNRFQKLVAEAKKNIKEISSTDAALELGCGAATLIDVRSDEDWKAEHARGAKHLNRGEIEVEIEEQVPDLDQRIICYCGGGSRSALVAESLQKMGYRNVRSMTGVFANGKPPGYRRQSISFVILSAAQWSRRIARS